MLKFKFSKLVRDKIINQQIASGTIPSYRKLSTSEHKRELISKIIEEAHEIARATSVKEVAYEIADVQQALDDLREKYNLTEQDIAKTQSIKNHKNGSFKKGFYIEYIEIDNNNKWVEYYRKNAERYPEIK